MLPKVFTLIGRLTYCDGSEASGVFIGIVERDYDDPDDLIGCGYARQDGFFRLSFTREAFNQDPGEDEDLPELYLVLSVRRSGALVPVARRDLPPMTFERIEDVGAIALPFAAGDEPSAIEGDALPGRAKRARRLTLDAPIIAMAAREVSMFVEVITGWEKLLEGVRFEVVDSLAAAHRIGTDNVLARAHLDAEQAARVEARRRGPRPEVVALFEPRERCIYLSRPMFESNNVDVLKLTLGHELVHVGQLIHHPELRELLDELHLEQLQAIAAQRKWPADRLREFFGVLANLEGYARYVEQALRLFYPCSDVVVHPDQLASFAEPDGAQAQVLGTMELVHADDVDAFVTVEALKDKEMTYVAGYRAYVERSRSGKVRFDPSLRPEVTTTEAVEQLKTRATGGCMASQIHLGVLYETGGGGLPQDRQSAIFWLRKAADRGDLTAYLNLAGILGHRNPESEGWLRRAADAGDISSMRTLSQAYTNGWYGKADLVHGRLWKNRADKAEAKARKALS